MIPRITGGWKAVKIPVAAILGTTAAAVPLILRTGPAEVWIAAVLTSSVLTWYAFLALTEVLHVRGPMWYRVVISMGLYLVVGSVFVISLALGASSFQLGRIGWAHLFFAFAWPSTLL